MVESSSAHDLSRLSHVELRALVANLQVRTSSLEGETRRLQRQIDSDLRLKSAIRDAESRAKVVKSVDACFVFDCTHSMRKMLRIAADKMGVVAAFIRSVMGMDATIRFAVVGYRDYMYDEKLTVLPFTSSSLKVSSFLHRLKPVRVEDQDECEDVISGLEAAVQLDWAASTRIVYLVCDRPNHGRRFHDMPASVRLEGGAEGEGEEVQIDHHLDDPRQWDPADAVFKTIGDLALNLVCLSVASPVTCAKMFQVFRALFDASADGTGMEVLGLDNTAQDFARCIIETCSRTLYRSCSRLSSKVDNDRHFVSSNSFTIMPVDWSECESWPQHRVTLTSFSFRGLDEDVDWHEMTRAIHFRPQPFAEGNMRYAFPVFDKQHSMKLVAKVYKSADERCQSKAALVNDAVSQVFAQHFAAEFSKRVVATPLQFVRVHLMALKDGAQQCTVPRCALLEPFIPGVYRKYTNNTSYGASDSDLAQAFTHFTWHLSGGTLMVTDIQGVDMSTLTDPQIHSSRQDDRRFGMGNLGTDGMDRFFLCHCCSSSCRELNLQQSPLQIDHKILSLQAGASIAINATTISSGTSRSSSSSVPYSSAAMLCHGPCGNMVCLSGIESQRMQEKYSGIFCAACVEEIEAQTCSKPCANANCHRKVVYSVFVLNIKGTPPPYLCPVCAELARSGWALVNV